jgi:hypothetical protein
MRLDKRFYGTIVKNKDGRVVPEDEWVAFLVTDKGLIAMLIDYANQLTQDGATGNQVEAVMDLCHRVRQVRQGDLKGELDLKVHGTLVYEGQGIEVPPCYYVVFRPHDNSFLSVLRKYRDVRELLSDGREKLAELDDLVSRVVAWRDQHPERCKVADVQDGELR